MPYTLGQTEQTGPPKGAVSLFERIVSQLPVPTMPAYDTLVNASQADVQLVDVPQVVLDTARREVEAANKIAAIREKVRQADLEAERTWREQQAANVQYVPTAVPQSGIVEAGIFSGSNMLPILLAGGAVLGLLFMKGKR